MRLPKLLSYPHCPKWKPIMAMALLKMGKKKKRIVANKLPKMEGGKEKILRPQHFSQQITGG